MEIGTLLLICAIAAIALYMWFTSQRSDRRRKFLEEKKLGERLAVFITFDEVLIALAIEINKIQFQPDLIDIINQLNVIRYQQKKELQIIDSRLSELANQPLPFWGIAYKKGDIWPKKTKAATS